MPTCIVTAIAAAALPITMTGQVLPPDRSTDWSKAGLQLQTPEASITVDITDFGGLGDGVTPNGSALTAALAAVQGQMAVIHFPPGDFLFTSTIQLPDSVVLHGATADSTTLTFSLGGAGYCITAIGQEEAQQYALTSPSPRGTSHVWTATTVGLAPGDEIRLYMDDADLVVSDWALGTTGQIARIAIIEPDGFDISSPLRAHYTLDDSPYFRKLRPVRYVGIECLKIVRTDAAPPDEWSNIWFSRASHCWVRGVESDHCNFAHVEFFASTNCEVSGCYFHHAFAYGGNGQGYGVLTYYTAGENLVFDNVFEHLRHSMIVLAGANGNVFAYNRSIDPYWNEPLFPTNTAGEIVMHGDHPYLNLFESNIVQNIVIDDSHGRNGPFNTLFRNKAGLWGLFMNNAPATDSVNFIGNDINGSPGLYSLNGNGHFQYGNNIHGVITPTGTDDLNDDSYYVTSFPSFLEPVGGWPQIGPNSVAPGTIPAALRYDTGEDPTICDYADGATGLPPGLEQLPDVFPNPFSESLCIEGFALSGEIDLLVRNGLGVMVLHRRVVATNGRVVLADLAGLPQGVYYGDLRADGQRFVLRLIKE